MDHSNTSTSSKTVTKISLLSLKGNGLNKPAPINSLISLRNLLKFSQDSPANPGQSTNTITSEDTSPPPLHSEPIAKKNVNRLPWVFFLAVILLPFTLGVAVMSFSLSQDYYLGTWKARITPQEKAYGIVENIYNIQNDRILVTTQGNVNGIQSTSSIKYSVTLLEKRTAAVLFRIDRMEVLESKAIVSPHLCIENKGECDKIEEQFQKTLKENIEKKNKEKTGNILRITPDKDSLRLIVPNENEVVLEKVNGN